MAVVYASARDRLGQTLGGKYVLEDVIGVGGTAVVYRAQRSDGTIVALKMLHDYLGASEEVCRRFKREAYVANMIEHPGTVRVLDDGTTDDGVAYLVLEMLAGESVEERRLRFGGQLPLDEVFAIADQLLAVLEIAHAKNVVHRDIKPSNLFVTSDMTVKVLDFGIARVDDEGTSPTSTKTGQMVGTPAFMPPEQALSRPRDVDARTDLWAVGATMFTLLSGHHVHLAESSSEHLVKAATVPARSLAKALPGVGKNVEAFVAKALAFSKDDRWPSARAMREQLARVRVDPGRRIGTSTFPPPPTLDSQPTFVTGERAITPRGDRSSDPSNISVVGEAKREARSSRGWILGAIIGAALFAGTLGFFAARSTRPAGAANAPPPPPQATTAAPVVAAIPPPPPAVPATSEPAPPAASAAKKATPPPPRSSSPAAGPPKKQTGKPSATVDVYKPF
jgi:eukaryotic-like serine/threonine-protein kinase